MSDIFSALESLRDQLGALPGVATSKIGFEANMTPADYPMVRIVPGHITKGRVLTRRKVQCSIYFGQPIHEFDSGLEALWESLLEMEATLLTALRQVPNLLYEETFLDDDRMEGYRVLALQVTVDA